ncbi:alpha-L-rhamnosidase [Sphingobacterium olei]|uniref:alpha-L-rhamnosidase n=1 Tax=Sphingobacterium olei TaxID=2571155 RepID=A0A4U0P490_9SPHI|nr:family 78 glycoside hydrolase catalytic domain [Sphingobacterium olei]TJZ62133.1 alpha-L-rhamnosidase [Sphingobacterium olei]
MKIVSLLCVCLLISASLFADLRIKELTVENRINPLGINTLTPAFSWKLTSAKKDVVQRSYRIVVSEDSAQLVRATAAKTWDSGNISSDQSLFIKYKGSALKAGTTYYVFVEVEDNYGARAKSEICHFHMGLLTEADWGKAEWIAREKLPDSLVNPLPLSSSKLRIDKNYDLPVFRKTFSLNKKVKSSYAYVSGLGHYELQLNGKRLDDAFLQPGWTKYDKEAYYVVYDLTTSLQQGKNAFAILLGNGFYYIPPIKGRYQKHKVAFGLPKLKMKVVTVYEDGTSDTVETDESWKVHASPIAFSSMYGGEDFDARILPKDWTDVHYDDSKWEKAIVVGGPALRAQEIAPTKVMETFKPVSHQIVPSRKSEVYDFGQNASGIVSITIRGNEGDTIRVYPAELLNADGSANQKHTGSPYYYQYIFGKEKEVTWSPRFTYYGLRYAEVIKMPVAGSQVDMLHIESHHIRNSTSTVGTFVSSDTLFNQIHELIKWGIQSNMVSVFTDCPHREKLGWLEQLHLMGPSVQYNFDGGTLFAKALRDMRMSQTADGLVPEIAPEYVQFDWGGDMFRDSPEWGSSSILLAWYAYQWYGDKTYLTDNYSMMKKYVAYLQSKAKDNILYQGLSDWYDIGPERPGVSQLTPHGVTGTAIYYYDLTVMGHIAEELGYADDKLYFDSLRTEVYTSFNNTFYKAEQGQYATGSQTAQAMAIYMGLVDEQNQEKVLQALLQDISSRDTSFTAGDVGHRYLIQALTNNNKDDMIYAMHKDDTRPGYGYQIRKGATALTESWAALPNVSNNHFMLGHLMEWFHASLGGIRQASNSVAFKHLVIEPRLLDKVADVKVTYETPYGEVMLDRKLTIKGHTYRIHVPVGTEAKVVLPKVGKYKINGKTPKKSILSTVGDNVSIDLGSGVYHIVE